MRIHDNLKQKTQVRFFCEKKGEVAYFSGNADHLWPHHPQGAVAGYVAHRLVGGPAALLHVEVEGAGTDAELEVGEPGGADVDDAGHHA